MPRPSPDYRQLFIQQFDLVALDRLVARAARLGKNSIAEVTDEWGRIHPVEITSSGTVFRVRRQPKTNDIDELSGEIAAAIEEMTAQEEVLIRIKGQRKADGNTNKRLAQTRSKLAVLEEQLRLLT